MSLVLAFALSAVTASTFVLYALKNNAPQGTHFKGYSYTLFSEISLFNINFIFSPKQILSIQEQLKGKADVIATSTPKTVMATFRQNNISATVEAVSGNYFNALQIKVQSPNKLADKNTAFAAISKQYAQQHNISIGDTFIIREQVFVVGYILEHFKGLYHSEVDIWLPWHFSGKVISTLHKGDLLLDQHWNYWVSIIGHTKTSKKTMQDLMAQVISRKDLLVLTSTPPVDKMSFIEGISYDKNLANTAQTSAYNYLFISLLLFLIALLCVITYAMFITSKLTKNLQLFLTLGINKIQFRLVYLTLTLTPFLFSLIIANGLNLYLTDLITADPAIKELLANTRFSIKVQLTIICVCIWIFSLLISSCLSHLVTLNSRIKYSTNTIYNIPKFSSWPLITIKSVAIATTSICIIFTSLVIQYSAPILNTLKQPNLEQLQVFSGLTKNAGATPLSEITSTLAHQLPHTSFGFITYPPFVQSLKHESYFEKPFDNKPFTIAHNKLSDTSFDLLGLKVVAGNLRLLSSNPQNIAIDSKASSALGFVSAEQALDKVIYDKLGTPLKVVAVVSNLAYEADPERLVGMIYQSARQQIEAPYLLVKKPIDIALIEQLNFGALAAFTLSYQHKADLLLKQQEVLAPLTSRLLLCFMISLVGFVAAITNIFFIAHLLLTKKRKTLAIYRTLGAPFMMGLTVYAKSILCCAIASSAIAITLFQNSLLSKVPFNLPDGALGVSYIFAVTLLIAFISIVILLYCREHFSPRVLKHIKLENNN